MTVSNLKSLIAKLNPPSRNALEGAAGLCMNQGHFEVDFEHLLMKLLEVDDGDLRHILLHAGVDPVRLQADLQRAFERLKRGNTRTPVLSEHLPTVVQNAWLAASVDFGASQIRTGHLLLGMLDDPDLVRHVRGISRELEAIDVAGLRRAFADITARSVEANATPSMPADPIASVARPSPALDQYTVDLTERAREGKIDPVLGRDAEVRQMIDILMRRRQNNPILTGEAGVGKTSVVEGLALRICKGDVPEPLQPIRLLTLDLGLLQAGASVKGEFESRLRSVIDEVKQSPQPIVLFIDEAHTLIGAGGQAGQNDAANLLKPALARGELRTIAATTWSEYKKYFEKDAALARRFQVVKVEEPDEARALVMMRGLVDSMQRHHNVAILDEAVADAVRLSARYLTGRQLPDKSVSVLDTACARVAISQSAVPGGIESLRNERDDLHRERSQLEQEVRFGQTHSARLTELADRLTRIETELAALEARWQQERDQVAQLRQQLDTLMRDEQADEAARQAFRSALEDLQRRQGDNPLVHLCVDRHIVAEVISGWTGVPLGKMLKDELNTVLHLSALLAGRVIGQDDALSTITRRIQTSKAKLEDPVKPIGVFLLVGPSGVGKTETALALADTLFGGERNLITINMSEYQEAHTVSGLKGSPPGYVGYGEGGVLTEAVRRKPYSVVLLDEVEKAHPDVLELFFQVFDKGRMEDAEGREIDFKNTILVLTSNVGTDTLMRLCQDSSNYPSADTLRDALRDELQDVFKPAFLGRLAVVPYYPVQDDALRRIVALKLDRLVARVQEHHRAQLRFDDAVVQAIASRCSEVDSGARNVDAILTGTLLPRLSEAFLEMMGSGRAVESVKVSVDKKSGDFRFRFELAAESAGEVAA